MWKIASQYSDFVMVTSDNPRTENPEAIIEDIKKGIATADKSKCNSQVDRKKAFIEVLNLAKADDVILIAGKGHEDYQIVGNEKKNFSDFETMKELLNEGN